MVFSLYISPFVCVCVCVCVCTLMCLCVVLLVCAVSIANSSSFSHWDIQIHIWWNILTLEEKFLLSPPPKKKNTYIYCLAILFIVSVISCFYPKLVCYSVILCCVDPELRQLDWYIFNMLDELSWINIKFTFYYKYDKIFEKIGC